MISFSVQNFGCRVNQAEAFSWVGDLQAGGMKLEEDPARSNYILVNTCTLTSRADRDVRKFIRKALRENPEARLVVAGCSVDREREEFEKIPRVWQVFSNGEKGTLVEKILASAGETARGEPSPYKSRALLKVQDGCDDHCKFCIIPSVRGRCASLPKEEALCRVKDLVAAGFKEVVLVGIHLSSYGLDLRPAGSLLELLREIEGIDAPLRVRLSSLDPRSMDECFLEFLTESRKICPHFHISLQSGSDRILRLMGRRGSVANYGEILNFLKQKLPDAALGADIIAGFPGESEEDFRQTVRFLEESPLTYFHVFSYSARPGTAAARMEQVEEKEKKERAAILRKLSREKNLAFRRRFIGRECEGIAVKNKNGSAEVLTGNYMKVCVPQFRGKEGQQIRVRITEVNSRDTRGEACS